MEQNTPPEYNPNSPAPAEPPRKSRTWMIIVAAVLGVLLLFGGTCAYVGVKVYRSAEVQSSVATGQVMAALIVGDYDRVWVEASPEFQKTMPHDKYTAFMDNIDKTYGKPVSKKMTLVSTTPIAGKNSKVQVMVYTFLVTRERGDVLTTITFDGQGRLLDLKVGNVR